MGVMEVKNLEQVLKQSLRDGRKFVSYSSTRFIEAGENYASLLILLEITIRQENGEIEKISAVGKVVPPNDYIKKLFRVSLMFTKEIAFYQSILPALQEFQRRHGNVEVMKFFPNFLGARYNLEDNDNKEITDDALIILENLKIRNYRMVDRFIGFNFEEARLVLRDLAIFHSVALAYKLKNPNGLKNFGKCMENFLESIFSNEHLNKHLERFKKILEEDEECAKIIPRFVEAYKKNVCFQKIIPKEPFATLVHHDFWVNNVMIKYENGIPVSSKLIDFQGYTYASPAKDVVFFIFSSIKASVIEKHYDDLIEHYYTYFDNTLKDLGIHSPELSFENFLKEIEHEAKYSELNHVLIWFSAIFQDKKDAKNIEDVTEEYFKAVPVSELQKEKTRFVCREFAKRNWI